MLGLKLKSVLITKTTKHGKRLHHHLKFFIPAQKKTDRFDQSFNYISLSVSLRKDTHKFQIREGKDFL